ncbi:MAG TPA: cobalamin-dependent protein [Thermoleophilia bacterium]|nr:cobalamin-dependent protein [Thermoleophilia bacterium]
MTEFEGLDPSSLAARIAALDEQGALDAVQGRIAAGDDPLAIIEECQVGMRWVGEHYQSGKYFISGLIMAGEIFREAMVALGPLLPPETADAGQGSVLIATVRGDIHDLGKNIVTMMLRSYGIVVHDLGVDVSPDEVVRKAVELQPDIVGLSGLLTVATDGMKATVEAVRAEPRLGRRLPVIIGGGIVDEQMRAWTGADLWASDASRGVRLIREAIAAARD